MTLKIASWNVNSLRVRTDHLSQWLAACQPDIVALQEIKCEQALFPIEAVQACGYEAVWAGQKTYNGVALLSRGLVPTDVVSTLIEADPARRLLAATYGHLRVINVYVPNGASLVDVKFPYKMEWLAALSAFVATQIAQFKQVVILGDFNIAPSDSDVHAPSLWQGKVLTSPAERLIFNDLLALGLQDTFRLFKQDDAQYSWWDYRGGSFAANKGLRIDHILASHSLCEKCTSSVIDKEPRGWEKPSDHTPVVATFDI